MVNPTQLPSAPLSPEQRDRIELNRQRALKRLQAAESPVQQKTLFSFFSQTPTTPTRSQPAQESIAATPPPKRCASPPSPLQSVARPRQGTPLPQRRAKTRVLAMSSSESEPADSEGDDYCPPADDLPSDTEEPPLPQTPRTDRTRPRTPHIPAAATPRRQQPPMTPTTPRTAKSSTATRSVWLVDIRDAEQRLPSDPEYDPRTLYIPASAWKGFTPFERQFWEIKSKHFDTVVFFKKGKFYELFEKDADIGHQQFDLRLTDRVNMRMVGVPESAFEFWAAQFIAKGYKVARVDQVETAIGKERREKSEKPSKEDSIIRRELTSILTAGTLVDGNMLHQDMATYCLSIKESVTTGVQPPSFGLCFVDTATGQFHLCQFQDDTHRTMLETLLTQVQPKELVYERGNPSRATWRLLKALLHAPVWNGLAPDQEFWDQATTEFELERAGYFKSKTWPAALSAIQTDPLALSAVGGLVSYLRSLKLDQELVSLGNFSRYEPMNHATSLLMDGQTMANLELFQTSEDNAMGWLARSQGDTGAGEAGTLFQLLNHCITPFGKRLFRHWLCHPLRDPVRINARLDALEELTSDGPWRDQLHTGLTRLPDLERLISRVHAGRCRVKDLLGVLQGFEEVQTLLTAFRAAAPRFHSARLQELSVQCPDLTPLLAFFREAFDHQVAEREGNIIPASGVEADYDRVTSQLAELTARFDAYLAEQRTALKCPSIQYRDLRKEVYQLEIPKSVKVPGYYMQLSATKAISRYWTPELQRMVKELNELEDTRNAVFRDIEQRMYQRFDQYYPQWLQTVRTVAEIDCLLSLAYSRDGLGEPVCRPEFVEPTSAVTGGSVLELRNLRHPCVPVGVASDFIPNDTMLGGQEPTMVLLTGPNAGGKSTLLRQTCLAVVMAQLGCYVPAERCRLTPVDRIFTRIGAHDDILRGQSTFMVELSETSKILREATPRSLVILDELGRGTSTFDGYAVAYAVLHHLAGRIGCLGLFSTHYHALTREMGGHPEIALKHMDCHVDPANRDVTFLYKLVSGVCPKSYGMNVANMAGIPRAIVDKAEQVAERFEASHRLTALTNATTQPSCLSPADIADFGYLMGLGHTASTGDSQQALITMAKRWTKTTTLS
ncbi:DNA mismatch repair protein msh6 [Dimargaris verticillata]|uniref:DNA mismatch repair protein n=1 Tax=Dimargaris verticillata TaxID=2761393 RepID=A0A9W8B622_9FUNG|nr:DNA mismatch repair protein msh6 [Dimargaris verticillata]